MVMNYNLEPGHINNTYGKVNFDLNPVAANDLTGAEILMQLRHTANGAIIKEYTHLDGVTIEPPYRFILDEQILDFCPAGTYLFDFFIKFTSTPLRLTVVGGQWEIGEVISKK